MVTDPKMISKVADPPVSPPLTVMTLTMQTILNNKSHVHEVRHRRRSFASQTPDSSLNDWLQILAVTGLVHQSVQLDGFTPDPEKDYSNFTAVRKLGDNPFPFDLSSKLLQKKRR